MTEIAGARMLVTGASSGIGRALAVAANAAGAEVIAVARREALLDELEAGAPNPERMHVHAADLADVDAITDLAARILETHGTPDILVNNAGMGTWKPIDDTPVAEALEMMKLPYLAAFGLTHELLPGMLERGTGHIVNMTSLAAYLGLPGATAYASARWAMRGFTHALAADLAQTDITVSLAYFAKVQSEYWENNPGSEQMVPRAAALIPTLSPEQAAAYLLAGIRGQRGVIRGPFMLKLLVATIHVFPWFGDWLVRSTGHRRD
jgi:short-subunit dehydrogenase